MPKMIRQRGTRPGRHHLGTPGDIISECLGDFIGIRNQEGRFFHGYHDNYCYLPL
jgi:hypothetical protein